MVKCDKCGKHFVVTEHLVTHKLGCHKEAHQSDTGALRYNKDKLPMHLVPPDAIEAMAEVLAYGANKYTERNWELEAPVSVPYASLMRHLQSWWSGENNDSESNLSHLYHVIMNAAMLIRYAKNEENDDRPTKVIDKLKQR
jgi:hypothetical protein